MKKLTIKQILSTILAIVSFTGVVWSAQTYLNTHFALAAEVQQLEKRLDSKIIEDRLFNIQEHIWRIEDRYYEQKLSKEAIEQIRSLNSEKEKLEKELDIIKKK